jgi:hypothetical protein
VLINVRSTFREKRTGMQKGKDLTLGSDVYDDDDDDGEDEEEENRGSDDIGGGVSLFKKRG